MTLRLSPEEQKVIRQLRQRKANQKKQEEKNALLQIPFKTGTVKEDIYHDKWYGAVYSKSEKEQAIKAYMTKVDEQIKNYLDCFELMVKADEKMLAYKNHAGIEYWLSEKEKYNKRIFQQSNVWATTHLTNIEKINEEKFAPKKKKAKQ